MTTAAAASVPPCLRRAVGVGLALAAAGVGATAGASPASADDYVVQPGDTVSHIALRSHATVSQIVTANNLDARAMIRIGQVLTIPTATAAPVAVVPAPVAGTHTVASGDTVWALARTYGSTVQAISTANGLDSRATIRVGQVLSIPGATGTSAPAGGAPAATATTPAATLTHTVVSGDTVSGLATRYGSSAQAISSANSLNARAMIRIGQVLTIPGATATTSTTASPTTLVGSTFAGRTYPAHVVAAANQNKANLLAVGVPSKADMQTLVVSTARAMGVDPALAQAVAYQESGFNHASVSPANAIGTMQVIPSSGDWASDMVGRELNLLDPDDNVVAGVAILRRLVETSADLPTAIAGYYQGQRSVRENGMYADTRRYVANVQTLMSRFA
jgi:LysM repeat protein